jgi:truncated hemoglobin YjbI
MNNYDLAYPIGKYEVPEFITQAHIDEWINTIEETPTVLNGLIENLPLASLEWVYRPHGWTIAQVIHHMCDSHTNALMRFKLSLTEDTPTIKPYLEGAWAGLEDYDIKYLHYSKVMLESVHAKFAIILKKLSVSDFHNKSYFHPESHKNFTLGEALGMYDWHSKHHLQHIRQALKFSGKF